MASSIKRTLVQSAKAFGSRFPRQSPLVWFASRSSNRVGITFDDGPTDLTPQVLECLREHNAKATFFVLGTQVSRHPDLFRQIIADGHEIGIHGYEHNLMDYARQVERCAREFSSYGVKPRIIRTPGCVIKPLLTLKLWWRGYPSIIHSLDAHDSMRLEGKWDGPAPEYTRVQGGDIVLMHDDNELCLKDLPVLLNLIREKNLQPVTISELLGLT